MAKKLSRKKLETIELSPSDLPLGDRRAMERILQQAVQQQFGISPVDSPLVQAQEVMYQAFEASSPEKQISLAKRALAISLDCADAYGLLAEHATSAAEALALLEKGVAAGRRALGDVTFREQAGHFWGLLETRPYMRARHALMQCLWDVGRREEAVEHAIELLRLNPNDNQGVRYLLSSYLLDLARDDELRELLAEYDEDSTDWLYTKAILEFRKTGEGPRANKALLKACQQNPHVCDYILGLKMLPPELPGYYQPGNEDEAVLYVVRQLGGWKGTPGALAWMRKVLMSPLPEPPRRAAPSWPQLAKKLALLPPTEECWQVDIRPLSSVVAGTKSAASNWMVLVTNPAADEILVVEMEPARPDAKLVWEYVIEAMLRPKERDPARPQRLEVRLKSFWTPWRKKLAEVGIDCVLCETLAHVDEVLIETIAPLAPGADAQLSAGDEVPLGELKQVAEQTWQADVRRLPIWVGDAGEPRRPWSVLVADRYSTAIIAQDIRVLEPTPDWLADNVLKAMRRPGIGEPHRPGVVQVASPQYAQALEARLAEAGVAVEVCENLREINELFGELGSRLSGPDKVSPLLEVPGIGPHEAGEFFAAAAEFYQQSPWRHIPGDSVIKVECAKYQSGPWYAVVMGQSALTYGLALYEGLDVLRAVMREGHTQQGAARNTSALSVTYGEEFEIPIRDLEAIETNGWPIAAPEAYPSVMRVNPGFVMRPPLVWELELVEGALRAIPEFIQMRNRKWATFTVAVASGDLELRVSRVEE
jgi:hypothetical protein